LQQITVPVGGCAGPIAVTVPSTGIGNPRSGTAIVTELARVGFFFVGANTTPADRLQTVQIINNTSIAGIVSATIYEAGVSSNQTRFNFFNASNPAQVKICKVAGPGIAEGTLFNFTVTGLERVVDPVTGASSASTVSRTFDVQAGPAAQGGFCRFVPDATGSVLSSQTFLVGTDVTVTENGPLANANGDEIRVARIRSTSGFTSPAIAGNIYFPPNGTVRTVVVPVRRQVVEVEYTNFVFRPGLLKICKIAGTGVAIGTPFTFDVSIDRLQGTFPGQEDTRTGRITVQAGPAAQGGFCVLVGGVFSPTVQGVPVFNVGSLVTVTERTSAGTGVTGIRTTSGGTLTGVSLAGGTGTVRILAGSTSGGVFNPSTTEIEFVNSQTPIAPPVTSRATTAYDFDGDHKADISVFRDGNWYINRSELGFTAVPFGAKGDKLVSADYDGDHKADVAVYRVEDTGKGYFYILNSRSGIFLPVQFGLSSDVPVVGDYDGDGISDMAVYREGKNVGDESFIYYRPSGTPGADFTTIQLGVKGDIPVVGDYDGDGKTDAAVYRPSNGVWYMLQSRDGFKGVQFGISTDIPVAADYDGDGKTDLAVYRGGTWYLLQSTAGFTGLQFGIASDMPVPADVDGDGKDDIVVFRAGTWYWLNSGSNNSFQGMNFGIGSDVPVFCPASHQ
ncbi:MAG: VCBS repeat-containing protein, partial [Acidobacteriota bacterium]